MANPPKTPPASDIEGVRQDEASKVDAAIAADQDAGDLERARKQAVGRPRQSGGEGNADDRSR
jgi:hypothetical protein